MPFLVCSSIRAAKASKQYKTLTKKTQTTKTKTQNKNQGCNKGGIAEGKVIKV